MTDGELHLPDVLAAMEAHSGLHREPKLVREVHRAVQYSVTSSVISWQVGIARLFSISVLERLANL